MRNKYLPNPKTTRRPSRWSCCQSLLFCACLLQSTFLFILYLSPSIVKPWLPSAITSHENLSPSKPLLPSLNQSISFDSSIQIKSKLAIASIPNINLEGVAITLMLGAPRWFQTRYTMMVQNILVNLPKNWKIQIFYTDKANSGLAINSGLQRMIDNGLVEFTKFPSSLLKRKSKKKELFTDAWLWQNVLADKVLVFGGNSAICGNSKFSFEEFSQYDYIGAPWSNFKGQGGEGGISFRSARVMLRVIERELKRDVTLYPSPAERETSYLSWGYEDQFFVSRMVEMIADGDQINLAGRNATMNFAASESSAPLGTFAASMTLAGVDDDTRAKFLSYCLELKMIFPSLHNPGCFGAHPQPGKCRSSICALQEPLKGGC